MQSVATLWKKIKSDPRHTNCALVSYQHAAPKHEARKPGMSGLDIDMLSNQNELVEIVSKMLATISSSIILLQTFIQVCYKTRNWVSKSNHRTATNFGFSNCWYQPY